MTTIELQDEQAESLRAKAAARGLTLETWLGELAEVPQAGKASLTPAELLARVLELQKQVKPDPEGWTARDYRNYGRA